MFNHLSYLVLLKVIPISPVSKDIIVEPFTKNCFTYELNKKIITKQLNVNKRKRESDSSLWVKNNK